MPQISQDKIEQIPRLVILEIKVQNGRIQARIGVNPKTTLSDLSLALMQLEVYKDILKNKILLVHGKTRRKTNDILPHHK